MDKICSHTFYEYKNGEFGDYIDSYLFDLKDKDKNYNSLMRKIEETLEIYPNIRKVIEDKESVALSEKEVVYLIEVLTLMEDQKDYENEVLFFRGFREAYFLFKKLDIFED